MSKSIKVKKYVEEDRYVSNVQLLANGTADDLYKFLRSKGIKVDYHQSINSKAPVLAIKESVSEEF